MQYYNPCFLISEAGKSFAHGWVSLGVVKEILHRGQDREYVPENWKVVGQDQ